MGIEEFYWLGFAAALGLYLQDHYTLFWTINSPLGRNLWRTGCRLSWYSKTPKETQPGEVKPNLAYCLLKVVVLFIGTLIGSAFSWYTVARLLAARRFLAWMQEHPPSEVTDARWHLRNRDMPSLEALELSAGVIPKSKRSDWIAAQTSRVKALGVWEQSI
jgi:hypothetical protein